MNIKINETLYPCTIKETHVDHAWDKRNSQAITLEMDHATAATLFVDEAAWSVLTEKQVAVERVDEAGEPILDSDGNATYDIVEQTVETDMSDFCVAGSITDNRDGTVTVKMGKKTDGEMLNELLGVLNND